MDSSIQSLDRVFFEAGPITIYWYGVLIGLGVLLGLWVAMREAERRHVGKETMLDLVLFAVPIAIICARAYYVIFEWSSYKNNLSEVFQIWNGGLAIHGGLIGAVLFGYFYSRYKNISFWLLADIAAPSIILGQAIGRWGNFMNQEAFGGEVTRSFLEKLQLPDFIINQMYVNGAYHHPTFLYESIWNILGFVILLWVRRTKVRVGEVFLFYTIWYSIGRFFIEGLRTDSLMLTESLRMAQVISLSIIIVSAIVIFYRRKSGLASKTYIEQ